MNVEDIFMMCEAQFKALSDHKVDNFHIRIRLYNRNGEEIKTMAFVSVKRNSMGLVVLFVGKLYKQCDPTESLSLRDLGNKAVELINNNSSSSTTIV